MKIKNVSIDFKGNCKVCLAKDKVRMKRVMTYKLFGVTACDSCGNEQIVEVIWKKK